ncbi:MAG: hypothetical protein Q7T14_12770, partial [Aestuariivirga sp.]|nr:hypothetical protein [Aestuariivirga sp.]
MPVQKIHTFVVHPKRGKENTTLAKGTTVDLDGSMFDLLNGIYQKSDQEHDVDIVFKPPAEGRQQNDCRDLICNYLKKTSLLNARAIAKRLEEHTDARSGMGLLFLIQGMEGLEHKIVISRFPTDKAIYVDDSDNVTLEFLERVFMKNRSSYKAVAYKHASLTAGFWDGKAVDKQVNNPVGEVS